MATCRCSIAVVQAAALVVVAVASIAVAVEISVTRGLAALEIWVEDHPWVAVVRRQQVADKQVADKQVADKQVVRRQQAVEHRWAVDRRTTIFRSNARVRPLVTM